MPPYCFHTNQTIQWPLLSSELGLCYVIPPLISQSILSQLLHVPAVHVVKLWTNIHEALYLYSLPLICVFQCNMFFPSSQFWIFPLLSHPGLNELISICSESDTTAGKFPKYRLNVIDDYTHTQTHTETHTHAQSHNCKVTAHPTCSTHNWTSSHLSTSLSSSWQSPKCLHTNTHTHTHTHRVCQNKFQPCVKCAMA